MGSKANRALDPSVLWNIDNFGTLEAHPRRAEVVYTVSRGDRFFLRTFAVDGARGRTLVESNQGVSSPTYSPDGKLIAFSSDFDGNELSDIYVIPSMGGKPRNVTQNPADDAQPAFSPDGRTLAFVSNRDQDVENIFLMGVAGGPVRQLTHLDRSVWQIAWRPDGGALAYRAGEIRTTIGLVDVAKGATRVLLESPDPELRLGNHPWSPDGGSLAILSGESGYVDVGLLDVARGKTRWLVRDHREKDAVVFSPDGDRVAYTALDEGNAPVYARPTAGGREVRLGPPRGCAWSPTWLTDGRLAYLHGSSSKPEAIHIADPRPRTLVANHTPSLSGLVEARHLRYPSYDGLRIPALIQIPRAPNGAAIVIPHGGPEAAAANQWGRLAAQVFATRGYVVMLPNYRGSTGYGKRFRKLSDHDLGGGDMRDVNEAARYVIKRGLAQADRIGIWGVSYGGYLALHCPTQEPDLWAAAVPVVGFFDWETCYEGARNYLRNFDIEKMGDVRTDPELFRPRSPANFLHRLRAPVLLFAGANDPRCPPAESRRVAERIRALGIPCEYHEYPDEGHYPRRATNEIDLLSRSAAFMDEHLAPPAPLTIRATGGTTRARPRRSRRPA